MGSRGRKSAVAQATPPIGGSVVPVEFGPKRPRNSLTPRQYEVWRTVIDSPMGTAIDPEAFPLLEQYCRWSERADQIAKVLDSMEDEQLLTEGGFARYERYTREQERATRNLANLAEKLRLAPSARTHKDRAGTIAARPRGPKPWEG